MKIPIMKFSSVIALLAWTAPASLAGADWKDQLEQKLVQAYPLAKRGNRGAVASPGAVLVVKKEGIVADPATDATYTLNRVEEGEVRRPSGFSLGGLMNASKKDSRPLRPGDRVYVEKFIVKDDSVNFRLLTVDAVDRQILGTTKATYYQAVISFKFPKEYLEAADFAQLQKAFHEVVVPEAVAAGPKTVELGQTLAEVEQALGKPEKVLNLGAKTIYVYKDVKILFVDGKVADVQ